MLNYCRRYIPAGSDLELECQVDLGEHGPDDHYRQLLEIQSTISLQKNNIFKNCLSHCRLGPRHCNSLGFYLGCFMQSTVLDKLHLYSCLSVFVLYCVVCGLVKCSSGCICKTVFSYFSFSVFLCYRVVFGTVKCSSGCRWDHFTISTLCICICICLLCLYLCICMLSCCMRSS